MTSAAGAYLAVFWTIEKGNQGDFAAKVERLVDGLENKPSFYVASVAREGENSVVSLSGWESADAIEGFLKVSDLSTVKRGLRDTDLYYSRHIGRLLRRNL